MSPDIQPNKRIDVSNEVDLKIGQSYVVAGIGDTVTRNSEKELRISGTRGFNGTVRDRVIKETKDKKETTVVYGVDSIDDNGDLVRTTTTFK